METNSTPNQLTPLFPNAVLNRLERLRIGSTARFVNRSRGEHLAGKEGTSTEFADYRDYAPGDDIRFVDWNIFSRSHRPYIKLYHREEEKHVVILLDASASMAFEGKLDRAKQLAAAFGLMGLLSNERVSIYVSNRIGTSMPPRFPPCTGRAKMKQLFSFIENVEGGGNAPLENGIEHMLKYHRGRGVCVVLSDFLTFGNMTRAMNLLFSSGLEVFATQILSPTEINPEVTGDLRLVDCETELTLDVSSANDLLAIYQEHRMNFENELATICQRRQGRFLSISAQDPLESVLFDLLRRKGWIE